ncbi:metalloendo ase 1-like [Brachionus plicatilis]|uniref:Metalloendo ase 1-like n=1 Tax=Brachionus plicatilis TaxID=10195 RepID=A0A3M7PJ49_BRAPC|nr:metalloendo ase 1-like [Brachionus plicatilis]
MSGKILLILCLIVQTCTSNAYTRPRYRYTPRMARWSKYNLTYSLSGDVSDKNQTSLEAAKKALGDAFSDWQSVSCFVFSEATLNADIKIVFTNDKSGHLNCNRKFHGTAAHAFFKYHRKYPATIHLNNEIFWMESKSPSGNISLKTVLLHEIGHVLGLYHSDDKDSVMYEGIFTNVIKSLASDDKKALQKLFKAVAQFIGILFNTVQNVERRNLITSFSKKDATYGQVLKAYFSGKSKKTNTNLTNLFAIFGTLGKTVLTENIYKIVINRSCLKYTTVTMDGILLFPILASLDC